MKNCSLFPVEYFKFFFLFLFSRYKCDFNQIEDEMIDDCFQI